MKQTALITILAHTGCYVPAAAAVIPITDQVLCVFAQDAVADDHGGSFQQEMRQAALAIHSCSKNSLVLCDELGRATAHNEGVAISWALIEHIVLEKCCKMIFSTHFQEIKNMRHLYPLDISNIFGRVDQTRGNGLLYTYKIQDEGKHSPVMARGYGIEVARTAGFPPSVIAYASAMSARMQRAESQLSRMSAAEADDNTVEQDAIKAALIQKLLALKHSRLSLPDTKRYLYELRLEYHASP